MEDTKKTDEPKPIPFERVVKRLLGTPPTHQEGKTNVQSASPKKRSNKRAKR